MHIVSYEDSQFEIVPLTPEKILELIEQAYPNPITPEDIARYVVSYWKWNLHKT